jgi:hypothetical protein
LFYILVGILICDIVHDDDTVGTTVVTGSDGTKTFLSCGVPNLQFDAFAIQFDGSDFEIDPNGTDVRFRVSVIRKTQQETGFAHTGIANQ